MSPLSTLENMIYTLVKGASTIGTIFPQASSSLSTITFKSIIPNINSPGQFTVKNL